MSDRNEPLFTLSEDTNETEGWAGPVLQNAFNLWFTPELDRRVEEGRVQKRFIVWGVQAIVDLEATGVVVNINDELKGIFQTGAKAPTEKGQMLSFSEIGDIVGMELTDEHPNAGHFTAILHNGAWFIAFDFRRNASRIAEHLVAVGEFLETAALAVEKSFVRPAIESLFAAVELMAKSYLLMVPDPQVLTATSHGFVSSKFNMHGKTGLAPSEYVALYNELREVRPTARYLRGKVPTVDECRSFLERARAMFAHFNVNRPLRHSNDE